jgi:type II secretory pathway component PulF
MSTGQIEAADKKQALSKLRAKGLQPIKLTQSSSSKSKISTAELAAPATLASIQEAPGADPKTKSLFSTFFKSKKLSSKNAQPFLESLLQLHGSGLPVADAVNMIASRVSNPAIKELATDVRSDLLSGNSLAQALGRHPSVFDQSLIHLVEAGEATGNLKPILTNSIEHMEERAELKKQIQSGMAYPVFVCLMAISIGTFTVTNLIPKLQTLTEQMGGEANNLTKFMIWLSEFAVFELPIILGIIAVACVFLIRWRQTPKGRSQTDQWMLRTPILSSIIKHIDFTTSLSALHLLLANGINSVEAMRLSAYAVMNTQLRSRFLLSRTLIQDGSSFDRAFQRSQLLDQQDTDLVAIGETTGSLISTLEKLAEQHRNALSKRFKQLTLIASTLALGLAVSLVALLIFSIVMSLQQVSESILNR